MHVTLLDDVRALGTKGATVSVPEGYAVNFLFPQHLAVKVDESVVTDKQTAAQLKRARPQPVDSEQVLAGELDGLEVVIEVPVVADKCRRPVTATEVRAALKDMGYSLPKKLLKMSQLDAPGSYEVPISLSSGFEAKLLVIIEGTRT